jgi:3',5'-cyclic AMP phosphodiesterase CpdA
MNRKTAVPGLALILLCLSSPLLAATDRPLQSFPAAAVKDVAAGADLLFVVSGDNRPTAQGAPLPPVVKTIFSEIGLIRPDFVIWTGDTVYGYCDSSTELEQEYQAFAAAARPLAGAVPLFNSPGNHEIHARQTCSAPADKVCGPPCSEDAFRGHFGQLYGSFDFGGAHFIALDTDVPGAEDAITGDQLAWLKADLEANKGARAIFLFSHTEFYSAPQIDPPAATSHPAVANRWELQDLFRRYPVKAVFSGHEHIYYREPAAQHDGIDYFVAGGAGAPLYAPPDRGGFSHYLVVRLSGTKVTYDVVEPGRLSLEEAPAEAGSPGEMKFWIVNSNDIDQPLPLRGIDREVLGGVKSLGGCDSLAVTAAAKKRDAWVAVDGVAIDSCVAAGGVLRLHFKVPPMPQGSVLVTVRKKG